MHNEIKASAVVLLSILPCLAETSTITQADRVICQWKMAAILVDLDEEVWRLLLRHQTLIHST